jgi:histidinol-phosphate/aromatic aminotransferase/cobyric acid decarboxylase-like protein
MIAPQLVVREGPAMTTPISRRQFATLLGLGAASTALRPSLVFAKPPATPPKTAADGIVRLSSNENPYGPSPAALDAMRESLSLAWRYPDERVDQLANRAIDAMVG